MVTFSTVTNLPHWCFGISRGFSAFCS
jgi:hypothetical protein